jgi:hypothetical protein
MPKYLRGVICLLGAALVLAGCKIDESSSAGQQQAAGAPTQAAEQEANPNQPGGGGAPNAQMGEVFVRMNQLAIGTLYLQSTDHPITAEQAATLLPLWQALQTNMQPVQPAEGANSTPAPIDATQIAAALDNIEAALTAEQKEILKGQTQEQLRTWVKEQGLMVMGASGGPRGDGTPGAGPGGGQGMPPGDGTPGAGPGSGQGGQPPANFTPPADFTPGAGRGDRGGFGGGDPMIDAVIRMLQELVGQ